MLTGVFLSTILLPFLFVFILFKLKIISNLTLDKREERLLPQIFSCVCYLIISFFLISKMGISSSLSLVMIANTLSLFAITIITNFWKISTHASGALGLLSITSILFIKYQSPEFLIPFIVILFLTISVCAARLYLRVHTLKQVLGGCLLGAAIGILVFYFL
jgi:membrane-associated phospholipid phosphatase